MAAAWHRSHASRVSQSHARGRAAYTARTVNGSGIASALRCPEVQYTMRVFTDPGGRPRRTAFHAVPAPAVIPLNTCNTGGRESVREIRNVPQASTDKTKARFNFHYWQSQPSQTSATRPARGPCRVRPTRNPSTERWERPSTDHHRTGSNKPAAHSAASAWAVSPRTPETAVRRPGDAR